MEAPLPTDCAAAVHNAPERYPTNLLGGRMSFFCRFCPLTSGYTVQPVTSLDSACEVKGGEKQGAFPGLVISSET